MEACLPRNHRRLRSIDRWVPARCFDFRHCKGSEKSVKVRRRQKWLVGCLWMSIGSVVKWGSVSWRSQTHSCPIWRVSIKTFSLNNEIWPAGATGRFLNWSAYLLPQHFTYLRSVHVNALSRSSVELESVLLILNISVTVTQVGLAKVSL